MCEAYLVGCLLGVGLGGDDGGRGCCVLGLVVSPCSVQRLCDGAAFREDKATLEPLGNLWQPLSRSLFLCTWEVSARPHLALAD